MPIPEQLRQQQSCSGIWRATARTGNPLSDSTSLWAHLPLRGEGDLRRPACFPACCRTVLTSEYFGNGKHIPFTRGEHVMENHKLWNSNLNSLTLAVWPWAIYLNLPEPQFPHLYKWCLLPHKGIKRKRFWMCWQIMDDMSGLFFADGFEKSLNLWAGLSNRRFGSALLTGVVCLDLDYWTILEEFLPHSHSPSAPKFCLS